MLSRPLIRWPAVGLLRAIANRNAMQYDFLVSHSVNGWLANEKDQRIYKEAVTHGQD
jgi:hypothetical protein